MSEILDASDMSLEELEQIFGAFESKKFEIIGDSKVSDPQLVSGVITTTYKGYVVVKENELKNLIEQKNIINSTCNALKIRLESGDSVSDSKIINEYKRRVGELEKELKQYKAECEIYRNKRRKQTENASAVKKENSEARKIKIIKAYLSGNSIQEIIQEVNVSKATVYRVLSMSNTQVIDLYNSKVFEGAFAGVKYEDIKNWQPLKEAKKSNT